MGRGDQSRGHGVVVRVVELLHLLFMREDIERNITPLPQPMIGITVDGGREPQPRQQRATAGMVLIPLQGSDNLLRRPFLQFLHEAHRGFGGLGSNQQVEVIGHEDPAIQKKSSFPPKLA